MAFLIGEIVANIRADSGQFRSEVRNVERQGARSAANIDRSFSGVARRFTQLGFLAKSVLASGLVLAGRQAVNTAAQYEQLRVSMDVLNGSVSEGARNFERLQRFSARTPFQLEDLASAQNMLQGFGLAADDAFHSLQMIGDVAAITGGSIDGIGIAFGQAAAEGKLMTRDIRQFINQGVPMVRLLAETMGVAQSEIFDLASQGQISFEILNKAFQEATSEGGMFANGMERQADTVAGVFSTLKDNISLATGEIGNIITEVMNLRETVPEATSRINEFTIVLKAMREAAEEVNTEGSRLGGTMQTIADVINPLNIVARVARERMLDFWDSLVQGAQYQNLVSSLISETRRQIQGLGEDARETADDFIDWQAKAMQTVRSIREIKDNIENTPPLYDNIFPSEKVLTDLEYAEKILSDILDQTDTSIDTSEFFDIGTIGRMREEIQELEHQLIRTTDPEKVRELQREIDALTEKIALTRYGVQDTEDDFESATGAARFFSRTLADGLDQVLFRARSVEDAIKGIIRQLASRALTTGIMALLGGGVGGSFVGAMFGGNRQSGGGVNPGRGYIVGERGPELFLPQSSGTIVPNQDMGSKTINLNVHVKGGTGFDGKDLRYVIDEQVRQSVRLQ